jgi:hypothetical protein
LNKSADGKPGADKPRRGPKPQSAGSQKPEATTVAPSAEPAAEPVVAEIVDVVQVVETPVVAAPEITVADAPVVSESASTPEEAQ